MDEEDTLRELADRIDKAARACLGPGEAYELVFIDDGSRDKSVSVVEQLVAERPELRLLELQGNFGKSAALAAGFFADFLAFFSCKIEGSSSGTSSSKMLNHP